MTDLLSCCRGSPDDSGSSTVIGFLTPLLQRNYGVSMVLGGNLPHGGLMCL